MTTITKDVTKKAMPKPTHRVEGEPTHEAVEIDYKELGRKDGLDCKAAETKRLDVLIQRAKELHKSPQYAGQWLTGYQETYGKTRVSEARRVIQAYALNQDAFKEVKSYSELLKLAREVIHPERKLLAPRVRPVNVTLLTEKIDKLETPADQIEVAAHIMGKAEATPSVLLQILESCAASLEETGNPELVKLGERIAKDARRLLAGFKDVKKAA